MVEAMNEAIPTSDIATMPSPKITDRQRHLMNRFKISKRHINQYGWTPASRYLNKSTQDLLRDECTRAYNENWRKLIKDTQDRYKDAKTF